MTDSHAIGRMLMNHFSLPRTSANGCFMCNSVNLRLELQCQANRQLVRYASRALEETFPDRNIRCAQHHSNHGASNIQLRPRRHDPRRRPRLLRPPPRNLLLRQNHQNIRDRRRPTPLNRNTQRVIPPLPPPTPQHTNDIAVTTAPSGASPGHTPNTAPSSPQAATTAASSSSASKTRNGSASTNSPTTPPASTSSPGRRRKQAAT